MIELWDDRPLRARLATVASTALNVLLGGNSDETLSSRTWRNRSYGRWIVAYRFIETLFWLSDRGIHCKKSYEAGLRRAMTRTTAGIVNHKALKNNV